MRPVQFGTIHQLDMTRLTSTQQQKALDLVKGIAEPLAEEGKADVFVRLKTKNMSPSQQGQDVYFVSPSPETLTEAQYWRGIYDSKEEEPRLYVGIDTGTNYNLEPRPNDRRAFEQMAAILENEESGLKQALSPESHQALMVDQFNKIQLYKPAPKVSPNGNLKN